MADSRFSGPKSIMIGKALRFINISQNKKNISNKKKNKNFKPMGKNYE